MTQPIPSTGVSSWGPVVSDTGQPTSATVVGRISSACRTKASWSCRRHRTRKSMSVDQVVSSNARRAAPMAASMSAGVPSAATPMTSSVAGFTLSNVAPPVAAVRRPSISSRSSYQSSSGMGTSPGVARPLISVRSGPAFGFARDQTATGTFTQPRTVLVWRRTAWSMSTVHDGQAAQRLLERDPALEPGQSRPEAEVDAVAERHVVVELPADVEHGRRRGTPARRDRPTRSAAGPSSRRGST